MASTDAEKKAQYKQNSYQMIIIGVILFIIGSFLSGELFTLFGVIVGGAGLIVLFFELVVLLRKNIKRGSIRV
jgi:membrane-bound ClpP family serine protease